MIAELARALAHLNVEVIEPISEHILIGGWCDSHGVVHVDFRQSHADSVEQVPDLANHILRVAGRKVQFGLCPLVPIGGTIETIGHFQSGNVRGRLLSERVGQQKSERFDVVYRSAP